MERVTLTSPKEAKPAKEIVYKNALWRLVKAVQTVNEDEEPIWVADYEKVRDLTAEEIEERNRNRLLANAARVAYRATESARSILLYGAPDDPRERAVERWRWDAGERVWKECLKRLGYDIERVYEPRRVIDRLVETFGRDADAPTDLCDIAVRLNIALPPVTLPRRPEKKDPAAEWRERLESVYQNCKDYAPHELVEVFVTCHFVFDDCRKYVTLDVLTFGETLRKYAAETVYIRDDNIPETIEAACRFLGVRIIRHPAAVGGKFVPADKVDEAIKEFEEKARKKAEARKNENNKPRLPRGVKVYNKRAKYPARCFVCNRGRRNGILARRNGAWGVICDDCAKKLNLE